MAPQVQRFGTTADGRAVEALHLRGGELRVALLTYGATLQDLRLAGTPWPLTLGAGSVAAYEGPFAYFGAVVGPVANRIAGARALIGGQLHQFTANEAGCTTLHSGPTGTHAQVWQIEDATEASATLRLDLADGLGGFPGNRTLRAKFELIAPTTLGLALSATSDAPTLINLANHSYWNLDGSADTGGHRLTVAADHYLPVGAALIPGAPVDVTGTAFDFRASRSLDRNPALDHNFCLATSPRALTPAATLEGARGVRLDLATTAPGLQVYDGRRLATAPWPGLMGEPHGPYAGVALEPQHWPDAPNRPEFPPILLAPGETYRQATTFSFSRDAGA